MKLECVKDGIPNGFLLFKPKGSSLSPKSIELLIKSIEEGEHEVVCVANALGYWRDKKKIKLDIYFENSEKNICFHDVEQKSEPDVYISERLNPFIAPFIARKCQAIELVQNYKNPQTIARYILKDLGLRARIASGTTAEIYLTAFQSGWKNLLNSFYYINVLKRTVSPIRRLADYICSLGNTEEKEEYKSNIKKIIKDKEIVVSLSHGALGDCMVWTSLPRLLKEKYNVDFYLSEDSRLRIKNSEILKLCFELNPYFNGFKKSNNEFEFKLFPSEYKIWDFCMNGYTRNQCEELERIFNLKSHGRPEIYYAPKKLSGYKNIATVDLNWTSGQKMGLYNNHKLINRFIDDFTKRGLEVEYIKPAKLSIFEYIDRIYSSSEYLCLFSGGNVVSAALNIKATVVIPNNLYGVGLYLFLFKNSNIKYITGIKNL
jgi:hypothetical protein